MLRISGYFQDILDILFNINFGEGGHEQIKEFNGISFELKELNYHCYDHRNTLLHILVMISNETK